MARPLPLLLIFASAALAPAFAQTAPSDASPKDVRNAAKQGTDGIRTIAGYLKARSLETRVEAVKQLTAIGGRDTIDPLIEATRDADAEVQIRAADGLVNYYVPGYVKQGIGSTLSRAGSAIKARFGDASDVVVDQFVVVRPDVVTALGRLASGGNGMESRANGCRAVGILRGRAAIPDLLEALRTKDNTVMYESLLAIQKIRDPEAGPRIVYLVRDLDDRVQGVAIETAGLLRATDALPALRDVVSSPRNLKAERAAVLALANMPEPKDRDLLMRESGSRDDRVRAAAIEGLGRLKDASTVPMLTKLWQDEEKMPPRLASAFALLLNGNAALTPESPFRYLINTLNSAAWKDTAYAYLVEAAREPIILAALYGPLDQGTRDEKIYLARVLAASGDSGSVPVLDKASRDADREVAQEGLRALRSLRARLGN